jgi:YD repeat-containing protein
MFPITNGQNGYYLSASTTDGYNVVKNFVQGVRLSQITFPNGTVTFTKAAAARTDLSDWAGQSFVDGSNIESYALGSIQVTDNNGFCKKDSLYYGYFYDNNASTLNSSTYGSYNIHSDAYRLRLDSVQELSCSSGLKLPPYKFSYFSELVPRNLSFGFDHWGFSNGVTSNTGVIPTYTILSGGDITTMNGANRNPSWPAMRGGALQQITYPTGGYTRFTFEAHDTYLQYPVYTKVLKASGAIGYGQSGNASGSFTTDANASLMEVSLSSDASGPGGNFEIKDPSGTDIVNLPVNAGATANAFYTFSANTTYTWTFYNHNPGTSNGASASVYEELATLTQGNFMVGGLRIKTLTNYNAVTPDSMVTNYTYNYGGSSSSGVLYSRPVYAEPIRNDIFALVYTYQSVNGCQTPSFINPQGAAGTYYITGGSVAPLSTIQGSHIGYNQVQVTQAGNGYSIYRYYGSNLYDTLQSDVCTRVINISTCSLSIPNFPLPPLPFEYNRGELKYEGHFNQAGQALKDVTYVYTYANNPIQTPGIIFVTVPGLYSYTPYTLQTARKTKMQVATTQYDPADASDIADTVTTYYGSAYHHEPTRKVTTTSTGDSLATNILYAFDFRGGGCDATIADSLPYYNTQVQNAVNKLDSTIGKCPNTSDWTCRYDTFALYRRNIDLARIQYITYRRRSYADSGNVLATCQKTALNAADTWLQPVLRLQAAYENASIETSDWKNTNLRQAAFTKYDSSLNPIGFAYPGRVQMIHLQAPSSSFTSASVSGNTISKDSRYLDESTFLFSKGNPQQVTGHDGVPISYVWDYLNTEPIAKVSNATVDQVAYTSFEADGSGSWTIPSGTRDGASAITGSKSYNLSNGACTRSGLTNTATYIVSYWSKSGSSYTVTGSTALKQGKTINGWTYFEHTVTGTSSVSVSGSNDIDELRLYPATAQMTTYTYSPLLGLTSQCDVDNRPSWYSYDPLGRLKMIRDQDGNILQQYDYQYQASNRCGSNCYILPVQTLAGTNLLGYPLGVFNVHGKLLGNAVSPTPFVTLWNGDTADARIGTLAVSTDSLHFNLTLNSGMTLPSGVTGMRYYQVDLAWNQFDGIRNGNATYVDFGDGTGMRLPSDPTAVASPLAANTTYSLASSGEYNNAVVPYYIHTYADTTLKTITFYHTDSIGNDHLDNYNNPASTMIRLKHFRGNLPQNLTIFGGSSYQQPGMNTIDSIYDWSSIHSIQYFNFISGDGVDPCKNLSFAQDFMQYNPGLQKIHTTNGYYSNGIRDTTFRLSRMKSNWNTYFTGLQSLIINDDHWNREDLSALKQLNYLEVVATTQDHQDDVNSPLIPIPSATIDAILNQVAAGAGQSVSNGTIYLFTGGSARTSNSDAAVATLTAKGWTISIQ